MSFILIFIIGIMSFTKTKIKLVDFLYVIGFWVMATLAVRNVFFLYLIGGIHFCNIITDFLKTYNREDILEKFDKIFSKRTVLIGISFIIILTSIYFFTAKLSLGYVDEEMFPVHATEWIKNNIDIEKMRIYNHFNFGSYLELNNIPVFIDSRSGIYCEEFSDTTVFKDYLDVEKGKKNYRELFEKYEITHALIYNDGIVNQYIIKDKEYRLLYKDKTFSFYEKINEN